MSKFKSRDQADFDEVPDASVQRVRTSKNSMNASKISAASNSSMMRGGHHKTKSMGAGLLGRARP